MKKYIHSNSDFEMSSRPSCKIDVIFEVDLINGPIHQNIAAAEYKGLHVPEGELLPSEKNAVITSQAYADYLAFIESVEDLITDYYDLEIYYKNSSPDNSFYYGVLAKNSDGSFVLEFTCTFRVSNHPASRSPQSQQNKKKQKEELLKLTNGNKLRVISKPIIVNKDTFNSYFEAIEHVDSVISDAVKVMTRKQK